MTDFGLIGPDLKGHQLMFAQISVSLRDWNVLPALHGGFVRSFQFFFDSVHINPTEENSTTHPQKWLVWRQIAFADICERGNDVRP